MKKGLRYWISYKRLFRSLWMFSRYWKACCAIWSRVIRLGTHGSCL